MQKGEFITYKLLNGKTRGAWQLGIKGMMAQKNGNLKKVQYIPGSDSIFVEDHKGDQRAQKVWFEDGQLKVHKNNFPLLEIIKVHKGYGKDFEVVDEDKKAEKELNKMALIEKALEKVNVSEEMELKANAIVLMGQGAIAMSQKVAKMTVKKMAFDAPAKVLEVFNASDYHGKYIAALSILREVVLVNASRTAVTWKDGKAIVSVAAGQDPIVRLGTFLSGKDEMALTTLQTLGEEIKRSYNKKVDVTGEDEIKAITGEKDVPLASAPFANYVPDNIKGDDDEDEPEMTLEEARDNYKALLDNDVPNNKKNDLPWIISKINENLEE